MSITWENTYIFISTRSLFGFPYTQICMHVHMHWNTAKLLDKNTEQTDLVFICLSTSMCGLIIFMSLYFCETGMSPDIFDHETPSLLQVD